MKPYYQDESCTIYHGDCREVLQGIGGRFGALVTDPPYGVEFTGKVTKHTDGRGAETYDDTERNFREVVLPAIEQARNASDRAAIFTGARRVQDYPKAQDIGGIVCPNGGGMTAWGFACYHPVLFYGTSPYLKKGLGSRPNATTIFHPGLHVTGELNGHPCPKPLAFMHWALAAASLEGEMILDPFMGSGTTLRAAKDLGRKAIGIEIEERYCEIAAERLAQEVLDLGAAA